MKKRDSKRKPRNAPRQAHAPMWLICCEGKSEVIYLSGLIRHLEVKYQAQGKIPHRIQIGHPDTCPARPRGVCGRQHTELYKRVVLCARRPSFEKVWMLFDLDADCDPQNKQRHLQAFKAAIRSCETDGIVEPIWSVPCFEYWLALHSGARIDSGSLDVFSSKIRNMGTAAIQAEMRCDKAYRSTPKEHHCSLGNPVICDKALGKPYYNSFQFLGGEDGCQTATNTCKQVYDANNPAPQKKDSDLDFKSMSCCSNMHVLIRALYRYFEELPSTK